MPRQPNIEIDDARCFLAINGAGSIRAAARALGLPLNTVRYRLERLEQRTGSPLFRRTRGGVTPTDAGLRMREIARSMIEALDAGEPSKGDILVQPGQLTLSCSDAIGGLWLAPRLGKLRRLLPDLKIGLHCDYDLSQAHSESSDIGIVFAPPDDQDLIIARLGTLHFMCYASADYLARAGAPRTADEVRAHPFIEQAAPGMRAELRDNLFGGAGEVDFVKLRTNSSMVVYQAVLADLGIAAMPTYMSLLSDRLHAIEIGVRLRFDIFYFFHRDARESPSVRIAIDWLKSAFDAHAYPCFADRFIAP